MNIIITAGGTSEKIDNVRKITNSSSGKLGMEIAEEILANHNDEISTLYYVCSKNSFKPSNNKVKIIEIEDTLELKNEVQNLLTSERIDCFIHSMAVSDYMVNYVSTVSLLCETIKNSNDISLEEVIKGNKNILKGNKISSSEDNLMIMLKPTLKIISLIKSLSPNTFLVGFKLLDGVNDEELINVAKNLLKKNKCNLVVANDLTNIRNGNHKAFIIDEFDNQITANGKKDIAVKLVERIFKND